MKHLAVLTFALAPAAMWGQPQQCTLQNSLLNGAYAVTFTGTAGSPVWGPFKGPVATMARIVFDGAGNFQATATIATSNPPANVTPPPNNGTYTVNRDCTGTFTVIFAPAPNGHYNIIVSPNGRQITMIATDLGDVIVGTASRLDHN